MGRALSFRGEVSRGSASPTRPGLPGAPGKAAGAGRGLAREPGTAEPAAGCLEAGRRLPGQQPSAQPGTC